MKNQVLLFLLAISFFACQNPNAPKVVMGDSPEIDIVKKMVENYEKGDLEANLAYYADTAKIYPQGWGLASVSPEEDMKQTKQGLTQFSDIDITDEVYEVVTLKGTQWLHLWGVWNATLKADGSKLKVPFFLNPAFKDGKITMQSFYADGNIISNAIRKAMEAQKLAEESEAVETE